MSPYTGAAIGSQGAHAYSGLTDHPFRKSLINLPVFIPLPSDQVRAPLPEARQVPTQSGKQKAKDG